MEGISLRPSDAQAGGFLDDADVVLKECRFVRWDYAGKAPESVALKVTMEDDDARIHEQYYSAGDPKKITPSADGRAVVGVESSPGGLTSSTNAVAFITSLVNAGFPEDSITNDVGVFDGMAVHVNQVAQPKRVGLKDAKENKTYLLVTKILRMPGEAVPPKPAKGAPAPQQKAGPRPVPANAVPTPTPSPAPVPGAEPSADVVAKARATVLDILAQKGGAIPKQKLPTEAFRALSNDPDRNTIVTLVFQDAFLAQGVAEGAFGFDGTNVTLG
jgi:hypothetical protein